MAYSKEIPDSEARDVREKARLEASDDARFVEAPTGLSKRKRRVLIVLFGVFVFGVWEFLSFIGYLHPIIMPGPLLIVQTVPEVVTADFFWPNVWVTFYEIVVGFAIASLIALSLAVVVAQWEVIRATIYPYIIAVQAIPKIVFTPIFITWFGFGPASKIVNAIVIAFFPLFLNALSGLMQVDRDAVRLMRMLTATRRQVFTKLLIPNAMPSILTGIRLCWTFAVIGVIVAEFIGSSAGIGYLIQTFNFRLQIPRVFVLIIIISLFTVTVYKIIEAIERRVCFWAYSGRLG